MNHPDYGWVNEKGEQQHRTAAWYVVCLDSPYRQFKCMGVINEIFSR